MHTDEGIIGLGKPALEGRSRTVTAAVQETGRYLVGQDPPQIKHRWQAIYRGGPILCIALSDILGKWLGQPVYQLLGGPCAAKSACTVG